MLRRILFLFLLSSQLIVAQSHAGLPGFMLKRMGILSGSVYVADKPVPNAMVAFFLVDKGLPPIARGMGRIPEFLEQTDMQGKFQVKLMAGEYYMGILLREPGSALGPPKEDEVYYFATDSESKLRKFAMADFQQTDAGRVNGALPETFKEVGQLFTVEGVLLRGDSAEPFESASVLAKSDIKQPRPDFISQPTGKDGAFFMKLTAGKNYYLTARQGISGNQPQAGEVIGTYGINSFSSVLNIGGTGPGAPPPGVAGSKVTENKGEEAQALSGSEGQVISGLVIRLYEVPDRQTVREETMNAAGPAVYEAGAALNNIYFATNSHELDEKSFAELDLWVEFFKNRSDIAIELLGHTDSVGSDEYNLRLSEQRAISVSKYLVGKGISEKRITIKGYGSSQPVAENKTEEGRKKNRRLEIKFNK